jgi:hypothetical protein
MAPSEATGSLTVYCQLSMVRPEYVHELLKPRTQSLLHLAV